jgi:hypothetical protein
MYTLSITPGMYTVANTTCITISTQIVNLFVQICYNYVCVHISYLCVLCLFVCVCVCNFDSKTYCVMLYGHKNAAHTIEHNCNLAHARHYAAKVVGSTQKHCNYIQKCMSG